VEKYFTSERGTKNPEKYAIVKEILGKMIDYAAQAMEDGEMNPEVTSQDVYQIMVTNLVSLLFKTVQLLKIYLVTTELDIY